MGVRRCIWCLGWHSEESRAILLVILAFSCFVWLFLLAAIYQGSVYRLRDAAPLGPGSLSRHLFFFDAGDRRYTLCLASM